MKYGASFASLDLDLIHINSNNRKEYDDCKESTLICTTTNASNRVTNENLHVPSGVPKIYIVDGNYVMLHLK